ncbi:FbpB family small basic protein [Halalkalibacterium ligniniphilum]|uniref:FbpB family small basic protein n=1 Tax=Halalkalibacterium ligniniphilum TaxID=1134413 RepID=UPI00034523C4|nr:FbpB family small basic protein [Halalkalibacterium ligniniphilum]
MRKQLSFEELVLENKRKILNDPEEMSKLEDRLDERKAKEFAKNEKKSSAS